MKSHRQTPTVRELKDRLIAAITAEAKRECSLLRRDLAIVAAAKAELATPESCSIQPFGERVVRYVEAELIEAVVRAENRVLRATRIVPLL